MSKHSARGTTWAKQRLRVLARDGWQCAYCNKHIEGSDATVDHVEPIALDPSRTYRDADLVAACRTCNGRKSDRLRVRQNYYSPRWFPNGI